MTARGSLFYLMGASGSGKDTLLDASLARLEASPDWRLHLPRRVQRYITRPADAGGETHHAVSEEQFTALVKEDRFCLLWQAHGLSYGIDREILDWLAAGDNVLVNGSRACRQKYVSGDCMIGRVNPVMHWILECEELLN